MNWYVDFLRLAAFRNGILMLAKKIATQLYNKISSEFENKQLKLGQIIIDQNQEKELIDYDIKKIVVEIGELNDNQNAIEIEGDFIGYWRFIKVNVNINFYHFGKKNYEFLSTELRNVIGHEIEHGANTHVNPLIPDSWNDDQPVGLIDCIYKKQKYLLNESEMNAYIREFMTRAKYNGVAIQDIIKEFIQNEIFSCNPVEINNHINSRTADGDKIKEIIEQINFKYQNKINQIYSNRRHNNE